jgi:uridine kinase
VFLIGVAGGSGSGKTTFAKKLIENSDEIDILHMDSYYLPNGNDIIKSPRGEPNFDHPDAFDWELLRNHLTALSSNQPIDAPTYNFITNSRNKEKMLIAPKKVLIVEGIYSLFDSVIRDLLSVKCFLDVPCDIRFIRRLERDTKERGRNLDSIISQYYDSVRPMYLKNIEPQKEFSDIVIGQETTIASGIVSAKIKEVINNREQVFEESRY